MLLDSNPKRLSIFAYYDKDGIVDSYVIYLLKCMQKYCQRQIVVVNGTLTKECDAAVCEVCDQIIYRENAGFDITAYKEGLLSEDISGYDEVLFYNQTIFGPVYPLSEMFDAMAKRDVDFWGLTRHKGSKASSWNSKVSIAPHVQSFFFAVRKSMLADERFVDYWQNLPEIKTYWDAVGKHEVLFTKRFADYGFKWDVYINTEELEKYNDYPLMGMPKMLLEKQHCPFFKRKSFVCSRHEYTTYPQGEAPQLLYDYIRTETDYLVKLINENITRTVSQAEIDEALTLFVEPKAAKIKSDKTAVVLWCKTSEMAQNLADAANRQQNAAVFCLVPSESVKAEIEPIMPKNAVCTVTNGVHGMQYMFKNMWQMLCKYEYLLYLTNDIPLLLREFFDATTLTTAIDTLGCENSAAMLEDRDDIGVLLPVTVMHQECCTLQNEWKYTAPNIKEKLADAGINVPLGENKPGIASRAGMFLARTKAVEALANYSFDNSDFDKLYSPCEYLAPLAAQKAGYLTATACDEKTAYTQLLNLNSIVQDTFSMWATPTKIRYDLIHFRMQAILDFYYERRYQMTLEQAFNADLSFKEKFWIILQIIFKPKTFAKLQKLMGKNDAPKQMPKDDLD